MKHRLIIVKCDKSFKFLYERATRQMSGPKQPRSLWPKILAPLRLTFSIVLLGLDDDQGRLELERTFGLLSLIDRTSIADFVGIIEWSVGVVSVDSCRGACRAGLLSYYCRSHG
jgi:hypothetical protein